MAKNKETTATETTTPKARKVRVPRTLSQMEIDAKQYYVDIKALTKLLPLIDSMGANGREKLLAHLHKAPATFETTEDTAGQ